MTSYEITKVDPEHRTWQAKNGPAAGQEFHSYNVTAKGPDGELRDYEISRKPSSGPPPLGVVEAEVKPSNGDFPDKLKLTPQRRSGGSSQAKDDYWQAKEQRDIESQARQGRAHAQEMCLRYYTLHPEWKPLLAKEFLDVIDWFHQDVQRFPLDAQSSGGPQPETGTVDTATGREGPTSERQPGNGPPPEEASPAQKRKLTTLFNQAGFARDTQKAVVLYRCRQEKATKDGASQLIEDLMTGATFDLLLAELHDAASKGDEIAQRAQKLIPTDMPEPDTDGLPELSPEDQARYA